MLLLGGGVRVHCGAEDAERLPEAAGQTPRSQGKIITPQRQALTPVSLCNHFFVAEFNHGEFNRDIFYWLIYYY